MKNLPRPSLKVILAILLSLLMLGFGLDFLLHANVQLAQLQTALAQADRMWIWLGAALVLLYVGLHAEMYRESFKALGFCINRTTAVRLFLKRNLVSIFLPAGFITSQAFFASDITRQKGISAKDVHAASTIFSISALLSLIIAVVPALAWLITRHLLPDGAALAFLALSLLFVGLLNGAWSFIQHGVVYRTMAAKWPALTAQMDVLDASKFQKKHFLFAVLLSCGVEIIGIAHVYISIKALGAAADWQMAIAGYISVLIVLLTAPFLRGIGAVEALLMLVLMRFGLGSVTAISATLLFRFFEFWSVLLLGVLVFVLNPKSLLVSVAPSLLLFALGIVNVLSVLTPSLPERVRLLKDYLPLDALHASVDLTAALGVVLLAVAFYLLRGLRTAWWIALLLSALSFLSHLTKGFDYEEASLALVTAVVLIYQRNQYNVRSDLGLARRRWQEALLVVGALLLSGTLGFFLLDHKHFGADFTLLQSAYFAVRSFVFFDPASLQPLTHFGNEFLRLIHLLGAFTLLFIAFIALQPFLPGSLIDLPARERAQSMVALYGRSALDYFKTYFDKQFFFPQNGQSFVAYKSTSRYALALENPVAPDDDAMRESILAFDAFCKRNGQKSIYYRIPSESAAIYKSLGKSLLPLGQEAVVDLRQFTMEGKEKKALRNTLNKMEKEGYAFKAYTPPLRGGTIQQLQAVSNAWLKMLKRSELGFSQGLFAEDEIKHQTVLTLENQEGKIFAFVNLIPGASPKEGHFDLMRRTEDAPHGALDFIFVNMFQYLKAEGFESCNLGLVPLSVNEQPSNLPETLIKLAYERAHFLNQYKSLRFFKDKFDPVWHTKYVAYDTQLDLINLPLALNKVVKQM